MILFSKKAKRRLTTGAIKNLSSKPASATANRWRDSRISIRENSKKSC
jgi:hypothetical protein